MLPGTTTTTTVMLCLRQRAHRYVGASAASSNSTLAFSNRSSSYLRAAAGHMPVSSQAHVAGVHCLPRLAGPQPTRAHWPAPPRAPEGQMQPQPARCTAAPPYQPRSHLRAVSAPWCVLATVRPAPPRPPRTSVRSRAMPSAEPSAGSVPEAGQVGAGPWEEVAERWGQQQAVAQTAALSAKTAWPCPAPPRFLPVHTCANLVQQHERAAAALRPQGADAPQVAAERRQAGIQALLVAWEKGRRAGRSRCRSVQAMRGARWAQAC